MAKSATQAEVEALQAEGKSHVDKRLSPNGRNVRLKDAKVGASAKKNGSTLFTRDHKFGNFMNDPRTGAKAEVH